MKIDNIYKSLLRKLITFVVIIVFLISIPISNLVNLFRVDVPSFNLIKIYYIILIILGVMIFIITLILFKHNPTSMIWLIFSLTKQLIYCSIILFWSLVGDISIEASNFDFSYNTSPLFLLFLGVPILSMIKHFAEFSYNRKKKGDYLIILKVLERNTNLNSINQINNFLINNYIELDNTSDIINTLLNSSPAYIKRKGRYSLTKHGFKYLKKNKKNIKYL